jgi:hypothetical protein
MGEEIVTSSPFRRIARRRVPQAEQGLGDLGPPGTDKAVEAENLALAHLEVHPEEVAAGQPSTSARRGPSSVVFISG